MLLLTFGDGKLLRKTAGIVIFWVAGVPEGSIWDTVAFFDFESILLGDGGGECQQ